MTKMRKLPVCILLHVAAVSCLSFCPQNSTETLRNVVVTEDTVIVGSSSALYRLSHDLVEVESVKLNRQNQLLVADRSRDGMFGGGVLACGSPRCTLSPVNMLSDIVWEGRILNPGRTNVLAAFSLVNDGTLSVTFGTRQDRDIPSTITRGSLLNAFGSPPYTFSEYAVQREPPTVQREFLAVFSSQGYQYFVANIDNEATITRLCLSDNGNQPSPNSSFASHFELELQCAGSEAATAVTFVNSTEPFGVETVLLSFEVPTSNTVHICAFNLSEINERMDQKLETCINGSGEAGFTRNEEVPCSTLLPNASDVSTCNLTRSLLLQVDDSLTVPHPLLSLASGTRFISMVYTRHLNSGAHYLFLGTTDGRVFQIDLVNSTYAELVRSVRLVARTMGKRNDVTQLVPSDEGDYVYALTEQQLLRHPVDPDESISSENCSPSPSPSPSNPPPSLTSTRRPSPSPSPSNPPPASDNVVIIAASVSAGVAGCIITLVVIIVIVAVVVIRKRRKKHKKTEQELNEYVSQKLHNVEGDEVEEPSSPLTQSMVTGNMHLTESAHKLPKELIIPNDRLHLLGSIGQGEFGIVYKAQLTHWHGEGLPKAVAVKTLKGLFTVNDVHNMTDEILKMKHFDHPNVMTLIGVCVSIGGGPAIIMPYMENGSLLSYLRKDKDNIIMNDDHDLETIGAVQKLLLNLCWQVAKGMNYLASQKFVHRDLAARNCMIDGDCVIKVADFGLAEDIYKSGYFRQDKSGGSVKLPFKWMALESLQEGVFSEKSDVWSFGVTCWEVFSAGKIPYGGVDPLTMVQLLESGKRLNKPSNTACSEEVYSVMQSCWKSEPEDRPHFSELVSTISDILESSAGYVELAMSLKSNK